MTDFFLILRGERKTSVEGARPTQHWYDEALDRGQPSNLKLCIHGYMSTALRDGLLKLVFQSPPQQLPSLVISRSLKPSLSSLLNHLHALSIVNDLNYKYLTNESC